MGAVTRTTAEPPEKKEPELEADGSGAFFASVAPEVAGVDGAANWGVPPP